MKGLQLVKESEIRSSSNARGMVGESGRKGLFIRVANPGFGCIKVEGGRVGRKENERNTLVHEYGVKNM